MISDKFKVQYFQSTITKNQDLSFYLKSSWISSTRRNYWI